MKRHAVPFAMILTMLIAAPVLALAQAECQPEAYSGNITVNGNPAPDNLRVTARIQGSDTEYLTLTKNGAYGLSPFVLIVRDADSNCENQHTVEFFVEGTPAGTSLFENGMDTKLNLTVSGVQWCGDGSCNGGESCSSCSQDCGACSSGGGGSSGGGSSGGGGGFTPAPDECTPDWECSSWSQCQEGEQNRTCQDLDDCDTEEGKPPETQECGLEALLPEDCSEGDTVCVGSSVFQCGNSQDWSQSEECELGCDEGLCLTEAGSRDSDGNPFTGMFLDTTTAGLAILALIILVALYLLWRRRTSKAS